MASCIGTTSVGPELKRIPSSARLPACCFCIGLNRRIFTNGLWPGGSAEVATVLAGKHLMLGESVVGRAAAVRVVVEIPDVMDDRA